MPSGSQDKLFAEEMSQSVDEVKMSSGTLDNAIDWIQKNLSPDDVFSDKELEYWAEKNAYKKE